MPKRKTLTEFLFDARQVHGDKYDYSLVEYRNSYTKVTIICPEGHTFEQVPTYHTFNGSGCPVCSGNSQSTKQFIDHCNRLHEGRYGYDKAVYKNKETLVTIYCFEHQEYFEQLAGVHKRGHGCQKCGGRFKDDAGYINKLKKKHGNRFDYTHSVFLGSVSNITVRCVEHNEYFTCTASRHLTGQGCKSCGIESVKKKNSLTQTEFLDRAKILHNNKYSYDATVYVAARQKVEIFCPVEGHGNFLQEPRSHLAGNGCPYCAGVIRSTERFIEKAKIVHGEKWLYEKVNYVNSRTKIIVTCTEHGDFSVTPSDFLKGGGCRGCHGSHPETQWLNSLNVPERQVKIKTNGKGRKNFIIVDGYDPETNKIFEFNGDYWHGNPKLYSPDFINRVTGQTMAEIYKESCEREQLIRDLGYDLVVMWENDWNELQKKKVSDS